MFIVLTPLFVLSLPLISIYDIIDPWQEAQIELEKAYPNNYYFAVGGSRSSYDGYLALQRVYIAIPDVFTNPSVFSYTNFSNSNDSYIEFFEADHGFLILLFIYFIAVRFVYKFHIPLIKGKL